MLKDVIVSEICEPHISTQAFELAECKGVGHPDTLCDGIAERISYDYVQWCITHLGVVLHHNFDKILLVAGGCNVGFGGGSLIRPISIKVGGRATHSYGGSDVPVASIVQGSAAAYLNETVRHLDAAKDCVVESLVGQGNSQLVTLALQGMANDTISCCAVWPRTPLEDTVYLTTRYLNQDLVSLLPIGEDVKVSAFRLYDQIQLIIAVPFLARELPNVEAYREAKALAADLILRFASLTARADVEVTLNAADDLASGRAYLTVTGTSAEMGDDGSVGRGNRASGLVAPLRPSSAPPAGKNPIGHPGKVYNVLAMKVAKEVVDTIPEVEESRVLLVATIGRPLREPSLTHVAVRSTDRRLRRAVSDKVLSVTRSILARTDDMMKDLLREYPRLF